MKTIGTGIFLLSLLSGCGEKPPTTEEVVAQAEGLLNAGQLESAIILLERQLEKTPGRVDVLEPLAFGYNASGEYVMAALTFSQIVELAPSHPEYNLYAAESLKEADDLTGAVGRYREYLSLRPDDRAVWVILADLEEQRGNESQALESYLRAEKIESRANQELQIGKLFSRAGNLAQAQVWYAKVLNKDESFRDDALLGLLETAVRSKRFSDALKLVEQLDAEYPGTLDASELATVRPQLRDWQSRREEAQKALAALQERQSVTDSEATEAVSTEPTNTVDAGGEGSNVALSSSEAALEEDGSVASNFETPSESTGVGEQGGGNPGNQAEVNDPREIDSGLADSQPASSKQDLAAAAPEQYVLSDSASPEALLQSAQKAEAAGDLQAAVKSYKRYLVLRDDDPAVWSRLSEVYLALGNGRWAQATASEALRRSPDNIDYVVRYLRAVKAHQSKYRALEEMEQAARNHPSTPDVLLLLAQTYDDVSGNERNARIVYERFLSMAEPGHPARQAVEDRLKEF